MKHCQWCDTTFETSISYQIYCSSTCREAATKEKITARYLLTRRSRRTGKDRRCKECNRSLSIYNDDQLCNNCTLLPKEIQSVIKDLKGLANGKP